METVNKAAATSSDSSTWSGGFEIINNSTMTVTNVSAEHSADGSSTVTLTVDSMLDTSISAKKSFETTSGAKDYWIVSFLDSKGNLCTGNTTLAFHDSDDLVTVVLKGQTFVVNIGDRSEEVKYLQKSI